MNGGILGRDGITVYGGMYVCGPTRFVSIPVEPGRRSIAQVEFVFLGGAISANRDNISIEVSRRLQRG